MKRDFIYMYNDNCSVSNYYNGKYFMQKPIHKAIIIPHLAQKTKNVLDINSSSHNIKPSQNKSYPSVILPNNNRHQIFNTTQGHYDVLVLFIYQ